MFNKALKIQKKALENERDALKDKLSTVRVDLREVQAKKKTEEEDIKHMVKMSKEKNEIEYQKKVMELQREKQEAIAQVKDKYRDKLEERLSKEVDNIKEMYGQILERLPNVSARLKGDI